jgi:hypothetical protein
MQGASSAWTGSPTKMLVVGIAAGLVVGLLVGVLIVAPPSSGGSPGSGRATGTNRTGPVPFGPPPTSNCFGGEVCGGSAPTVNGSGTVCQISGFAETPGDFLYVAINYLGGTNQVLSVTDGGLDSFQYVGGEFANAQSVALYDVLSAHGGPATISVTLGAPEFGACTVGELTGGTQALFGDGDAAPDNLALSVAYAAVHAPSLLLTLFGATRPTGSAFVSVSGGATGWLVAGPYTGYTYEGTAQALYGENDTSSGVVTFTWQTGNGQAPSIRAIVVELYLAI